MTNTTAAAEWFQDLMALSSRITWQSAIAQVAPSSGPSSLFWLGLVFVVALIVTRLYKNRPIRFGMRTLLIVTTLVAVALGLAVFAMRN